MKAGEEKLFDTDDWYDPEFSEELTKKILVIAGQKPKEIIKS